MTTCPITLPTRVGDDGTIYGADDVRVGFMYKPSINGGGYPWMGEITRDECLSRQGMWNSKETTTPCRLETCDLDGCAESPDMTCCDETYEKLEESRGRCVPKAGEVTLEIMTAHADNVEELHHRCHSLIETYWRPTSEKYYNEAAILKVLVNDLRGMVDTSDVDIAAKLEEIEAQQTLIDDQKVEMDAMLVELDAAEGANAPIPPQKTAYGYQEYIFLGGAGFIGLGLGFLIAFMFKGRSKKCDAMSSQQE